MAGDEINLYAGYLGLFSAIIAANNHSVRNTHGTNK